MSHSTDDFCINDLFWCVVIPRLILHHNSQIACERTIGTFPFVCAFFVHCTRLYPTMKNFIRINISRIFYVLLFTVLTNKLFGLNEFLTNPWFNSIFQFLQIFLSFLAVTHPRLFFVLFYGWSLVPYVYNEVENYSWYVSEEPQSESYGNSTSNFMKFVNWNLLDARVGDMIEFERNWWFFGTFTHWGISDGGGNIIHFVVDKNGIGKVKYEPLNHVAYQGLSSFFQSQGYFNSLWTPFFDGDGSVSLVRVNLMERLASSMNLKRRSPTEIFEEAMKALVLQEEQQIELLEYNAFRQNCEHFVTNICYGRPFSSQIDNWFNYWFLSIVNDYKTVFIAYQTFVIVFSSSNMRKLAKVLLTVVFTEDQLVKIVSYIDSGLDFFENAVHDNVQVLILDYNRLWFYLSVQLFLIFKKKSLEILRNVNRIYRRQLKAKTKIEIDEFSKKSIQVDCKTETEISNKLS